MTVAIVLAAGKGTRMRSSQPKVAHTVAGLPMIAHVHRAIASVPDLEPLYVLGHAQEQVRALLPSDVQVVLQLEQRGTGHAVQVALDALGAEVSEVLVLYGDMPLVTPGTLESLRDRHRREGAMVTLLSANLERPQGYGRVIRDGDDRPTGIIEDKWLTGDQQAITEINTGLYAFDVPWLRATLPSLARHGDDEIYLTDLVERAAAVNQLVVVPDALREEIIGINDRVGLAHAERLMRRRVNEALMLSGVTFIDPESTYIAADASIGGDTVIEPTVIVEAGVTIGRSCHIGAQTRIIASSVGDHCTIHSSQIEFADIADHVSIGPFCHLRAGTTLGSGVHMGNFAETKNSSLGAGTKMGHCSYLGDAMVGDGVNVGAGTITANYDGLAKHRTTIGSGAFIGVGTLLRAPVRVGEGAYTGAGSVVLHDVPPHATVAGTPAQELRRHKVRPETGAGRKKE